MSATRRPSAYAAQQTIMGSVGAGGTDAHAETVVEVAQALLQLRLRIGGALLLALERLDARRPLAAVQVGLLPALLEIDLQIAAAGEPAALVVGVGARAAGLLLGDALLGALGVRVEAVLDVGLEVQPALIGRGADAGALVVARPFHALPGLARRGGHLLGLVLRGRRSGRDHRHDEQ